MKVVSFVMCKCLCGTQNKILTPSNLAEVVSHRWAFGAKHQIAPTQTINAFCMGWLHASLGLCLASCALQRSNNRCPDYVNLIVNSQCKIVHVPLGLLGQ